MFPLYCSRQRVQREARLALIFLARCAIWNCCAPWLLAPSGSLCGVLRGVESLACVLGCLRRASPRGARAAWFLYVLWSLGVAWFLWWCYFVAIVAVSLVGCPVAGARVFLTDGSRAGGRMRFHVNNQGRVLPCRAKHACRFGAAFENGGAAQAVLDRYHEAVGVEPRITGDLQALGLNLWNLQFRVKSASGTVDKVLNRGKRFDALYDVIRYTSVSDVGDYYEDFNRAIRTLTAKGYQVVEVTDFWKLTEESRAKGGYKGVNVKMDSPDGAHFELQFHTPESLQAKESVHVLYERLRRPGVTAAEREEVCRAMDATFSSLETPVDVLTARR